MKTMIKFVFLMLFIQISCDGIADTHYAATNSAGTSPYTNGWGSAGSNITTVVSQTSDGDTVLISNGTYSLTTVISVNKANLTLRGFTGNPDDVIITGNGANLHAIEVTKTNSLITALTLSNFNAPTLDGGGINETTGSENSTISNCVIVNCTGKNGGGVNYDVTAGSSLLNCRIEGNSATTGSGGGLCNPGLINNCTIRRNTSPAGGGIVENGGRSINIFNSTLSENSATTSAGGAKVTGAGVVSNCTIVNNTGALGGGLSFAAAGAQLYNCLIANNSAVGANGYGGGAYIPGVDSRLYNCTVVGNTASVQGGGLYDSTSSTTSRPMLNTIVYSNTASSYQNYNFITNGFTNCCAPGLSGQGNIGAYPKFISMVTSNYRLTADSTCINAGLNKDWMTGDLDRDGHRRLDRLRGIVDIGCYEYVPSGVVFKMR